MWAMCDPSGPIENGTTYIVRPRIEPLNSSLRTSRISAGSRQLLVGPASSSRSEQMKVRSSTLATSSGSERARYEFGRFASESFSKVPLSTSSWQRRSYSSAEPSHQWIDSGLGQVGELLHPGDQLLVLGQCFGGGRGLAQGWDQLLFVVSGTANARKSDPGRGAIVSHPAGWRRQLQSELARLILVPARSRPPGKLDSRASCASTSTSHAGSSSGRRSRSPSTASARPPPRRARRPRRSAGRW